MATNNGFTMTLPTLDNKNYERWHIQMKVLFGYQEVLDIIQEGYQSVDEDATEAQRLVHRDCKKRDCKALLMIHQYVDESNFEKISNAKTAKEAWDSLEKCYAGAEKVKKVKLQTLRREYELLQMRDGDTIAEYFTKIRSLTNLMKGYGEVNEGSIGSRKGIEDLKPKRNSDQALKAQASRRPFNQGNFTKKLKNKWKSDKGRTYEGARHDSNSFSGNRGSGQDQMLKRNKKKFDKKKIQCFNCKNFGHFASECRFKVAHGSGP
ncbi:PREDICTED: uncharacterized protein LOC109346996 [Lupinus angustifolius]|uniref:uncharacterized protein LOC109346996 n=1 Tax=Lupinus angustifolius TaxID=3871 RepID=UPI00092EAE89|nr:PREDICTED: uncharacterized protein LOC109346996 [Lupinus angustifolius]